MNQNELQKKLIAAARLEAPDDRVPYAFEKRVMAHLASRGVADHWLDWSHNLWRAAVSCVAIALLCGGIALFAPHTTNTGSDLSQDLDNTLLASADQADTAP